MWELIIGLAVGFLIGLYIMSDEEKNGYKRGQIDAANGKNKYKLVEFSDGTREYHTQSEIEDFDGDDFKIIQNSLTPTVNQPQG